MKLGDAGQVDLSQNGPAGSGGDLPPFADETGKGREIDGVAARRTRQSKLQKQGWQKNGQNDLQALGEETRTRDMEVVR